MHSDNWKWLAYSKRLIYGTLSWHVLACRKCKFIFEMWKKGSLMPQTVKLAMVKKGYIPEEEIDSMCILTLKYFVHYHKGTDIMMEAIRWRKLSSVWQLVKSSVMEQQCRNHLRFWEYSIFTEPSIKEIKIQGWKRLHKALSFPSF